MQQTIDELQVRITQLEAELETAKQLLAKVQVQCGSYRAALLWIEEHCSEMSIVHRIAKEALGR